MLNPTIDIEENIDSNNKNESGFTIDPESFESYSRELYDEAR